MRFFIKDFFSKCDQICSFLRIWSHLLKKSLMENLIFVWTVLSAWLKLDADLSKWKRRIFMINFGRSLLFLWVMQFCEKTACLTDFVVSIFYIFIKVQIRLSAQSEQTPTKKFSFLNEVPMRHSRLLTNSWRKPLASLWCLYC